MIKAGFIVGGEYEEGVLRIDGKTAEYYNTISASFGFQAGVQEKCPSSLFLQKRVP